MAHEKLVPIAQSVEDSNTQTFLCSRWSAEGWMVYVLHAEFLVVSPNLKGYES